MVSATGEGKPGGPGSLRIGLGILGAGIAVVAGQALGGELLGALGLPATPLPEGTDAAGLARAMPLAAAVLAVGLAPLARGLKAAWWLRALALAGLVGVVWGLATAMEARLFVAPGARPLLTSLATGVLPSLGAGAALATLGRGGRLPGRQALGAASRAGRIVILVVLFPVAYLGFGWLAWEVVGTVYPAGALELTQPTWAAGLPVVAARSVLVAGVVLPVVRLWGRDASRLPVALGAALFVLLGGYDAVLATWLPGGLRVAWAVQSLAAALFYASAAAMLLCVPPGPDGAPGPGATAG